MFTASRLEVCLLKLVLYGLCDFYNSHLGGVRADGMSS